MEFNETEVLKNFIANTKFRYPEKLKDIDLRCLYVIGMRDLDAQGFPLELDRRVLLNNALIFCATDAILKTSKDITWDLLIELKTQRPYLGVDIR